MGFKENWQGTQERFRRWWNQENTGRPLMHLVARKPGTVGPLKRETFFRDPEDLYFNGEKRCEYYEKYAAAHLFLAEAFPNVNLDYGPTSLALYVGSEPDCHWDTLWYRHISEEEWERFEQKDLSLPNRFLTSHLEMLRQGKTRADGRYLVNIPDIGCSMDVMSLLRGSEDLIYDLIDEPERMELISQKLTECYFSAYDQFYDIVKEPDGGSAFTAFKVWAPGRMAKLECDFCALIDPELFDRFALPALRCQAAHIDYPFYHLDGPDAIKHLDKILSIPQLRAIQWTHGAGNPDGLWDGWYEKIYDKVVASGRSLYLFIEEEDPDTAIRSIRDLQERYGSNLFLRFLKELSLEDAEKILEAFPE